MPMVIRKPNSLVLPIIFAVLFLFASPAIAGYLNVVIQSRLPKETVEMLSELRKLERYVEEWQPTWPYDRSKEEIKARIGEISKRSEELLVKNEDNGELHLLCGLIAFYGHNIDMEDSRDRADRHFAAAQRIIPDDYRPLWFLGMHLVKSTRSVEGMKALLEAEKKQSIREPLFWEDYATAACATNMFGHSLNALEKVRELSGNESWLDDIIGKKLREAAKTPKPGEKLEPQDLWQFSKRDTAVRIVSYPFGYRFSVPKRGEDELQFTEFDGRFAVFKVRLTPQTGAGGVIRIPTIQIFTFIAPEQESLENFMKRFLGGPQKWEKYDLGLGLDEISYRGESTEAYIEDGGARLVMIAFERNCPKVSRLALEEPIENLEEHQSGADPRWYHLTGYFQRFKERLFYMICLETPTRFFEQSSAEFKEFFSTFIVE
jgi:hypothetical protein